MTNGEIAKKIDALIAAAHDEPMPRPVGPTEAARRALEAAFSDLEERAAAVLGLGSYDQPCDVCWHEAVSSHGFSPGNRPKICADCAAGGGKDFNWRDEAPT